MVELIEPRERRVQICLVENLAAAEHVAFEGENTYYPPLGAEAFWRGLMRQVGDNRTEAVQPVHLPDECAQVRREIPCGVEQLMHFTGCDRSAASVVDVYPVRRCRR